MIRKVDFLERQKVARSDGLSASFLKNDDGFLASELTKLLGSIHATEGNPKDWCALVIVPIYKPKLFIAGEQPSEVERFGYSGICISPGGRVSDEVSSRRQKVRLVFTNLRHRRDTRLSTKCRIYSAAMRSVML